jgi:CBS domain-containing protein
MPVLSPRVPFEHRNIHARNEALRTLQAKPVSEVMQSDFERLFFKEWDSALEDLFEHFQMTDHVWITRGANPEEVIALLTLKDLRRLIVPVELTYSSMSRRDLHSMEHQTVGCVGCIIENAMLWSVTPTQTVSDALRLMETHDLPYLAVVEGTVFLGEVSVQRLAHEITVITERLDGKAGP